MAVAQTPYIRTLIAGDGLTSLDSNSTFTLSEKLEVSRLIKLSDGEITIDFSYINTVKSMYFESSDDFTLTFTVGTNIIPFEVSGSFRLDPTPEFRALIDSVSISTSSETDIEVAIRIYGE